MLGNPSIRWMPGWRNTANEDCLQILDGTGRHAARTRHPQSREAKVDEEIRYREQTCWLWPTRGFLVMVRWRLEFSRAARRQTRCPVRSVSQRGRVRAGSHCNATASPHRRDHVTRTAHRTRRARRRRRPAWGLPAAGCWRVGWGVRPRQKICTLLRMRWRTSARASSSACSISS